MISTEYAGPSSNWKALQARLKNHPSSLLSQHKNINGQEQHSLKRKGAPIGSQKVRFDVTKPVNKQQKNPPQKALRPPKRRKMDQPASIIASSKTHEAKSLPQSVSMLSPNNMLASSSRDNAIPATSILNPDPDFPDADNKGVSEAVLPGKYIALDCEMVGIGPNPKRDSALARVSVVDFHGHQIYDSYVQVPSNLLVTDYRTAVSGIEPRHLHADTARPFDHVRKDLQVLLKGRILVGHAVKHDLDVLMIRHEKRFIRDTSKFSKFRALSMIPGQTPGLKLLAEKLLGVDIQVGAHSSVEDARATMALYKLNKDDFEQEIRRNYGPVRLCRGPQEVQSGKEEVERKGKDKKKGKKKKKKN